MNKEKEDLFSRHILLNEFGIEAQKKLLDSKICVIGCGGLGCGSLPYLTSAGVGDISIFDLGEVELSNLQRQVLYGLSDVGKEKASTAYSKLSQISHSSNIVYYEEFITEDNILEFISNDYDLVLDCTDNFKVRYLLADYCWNNDIPLISAAVLEFEGHIMSFVRAKNNPCLRCLMPEAPVNYSTAKDVGVFGPAVGVMGTLEAVEAVKMLTGTGQGLERTFLSFDFLRMRINKMCRDINTECTFCSRNR